MDLWPPKTVIVDADAGIRRRKLVCFVGGLDLCNGRYDNLKHPIYYFAMIRTTDVLIPSLVGDSATHILQLGTMLPPKIKSFIDGVVATPLEKIQEPLKRFVWEFEKGDFHHWLDLFNHFEHTYTEHKDMPFLTLMNILSNFYERKKLKKGQTQGEVGDAGQVKENVMEKKKVKVVEPKDAQSSG
ncbi:E3 ubiquitin protein ligase UPL1-like protein [Tanacetum coccineum]